MLIQEYGSPLLRADSRAETPATKDDILTSLADSQDAHPLNY